APAVEALARNPARSRLRVLGLPSLDRDERSLALGALIGGEPFPQLHTLCLDWWRAPAPKVLDGPLRSPKLPRPCRVRFSVSDRDLGAIAPVFRAHDRIAWAGGEMSDGGDGLRVSVKPETVYLPNHLDDL